MHHARPYAAKRSWYSRNFMISPSARVVVGRSLCVCGFTSNTFSFCRRTKSESLSFRSACRSPTYCNESTATPCLEIYTPSLRPPDKFDASRNLARCSARSSEEWIALSSAFAHLHFGRAHTYVHRHGPTHTYCAGTLQSLRENVNASLCQSSLIHRFLALQSAQTDFPPGSCRRAHAVIMLTCHGTNVQAWH